MEWREADGIEWLEARLPGARAAFSTRSAGDIKASHERLAAALGLDVERIAVSHQVHGAELAFDCSFARHDEAKEQRSDGVLEVDGHVVTQSGAAALVKVADCLPVAVAGPRGTAILHCGWRGLAAGIVAKGAAAVEATHAAVGPGIGPCCYEVGDEVLDAFAPLGEGIAGGRMLDLAEVARRLLREAGVEAVESANLCTRCEIERFFSHRRDGDPRRQAGVVWLDRGGT
ncbi:MAG TPA: polyphenol oxidase family protein [Solirubrobacterales bacterium]|nr:polyphenol oxidase family protein [Solirubrobacterales bacterium]